MVFAEVAIGVVKIQTSGAIWVGRLVTEALNIYNEHFEVISAMLFAYKAAIQDGEFANGWKGVVMLQNWPFAPWQAWNWLVESSTAMVASLVTPKYLLFTS